MPNLFYSIARIAEGEATITVFIPGAGAPLSAHESHPNWNSIVSGAIADDESIVDLFDIAKSIETRFEQLSERVSVRDGVVYVDGDEIDSSIANQITAFLEAGISDWAPLVLFLENVLANPNSHSRKQLYEWLKRRDFTITEDGFFVGYKGVKLDENDDPVSIHAGPGIVDGQEMDGHLPNYPGAVVEMSRSEVHHDPSVGCSTGLHVGTYDYALSWSQGALLEVHVNPRDVVSVPTDCDWAKVRTCRYTVVDVIDVPYTTPLRGYEAPDSENDWYEGVIEWGDAEPLEVDDDLGW